MSNERLPYPSLEIHALSSETAFQELYTHPAGTALAPDLPLQAEYLQVYLMEIGCKTVIVESHYIDHTFMHDDAVYYVRSLRSYPNFTKRLHFFSKPFDDTRWRKMIERAGRGAHSRIQKDLQKCYLGFSVVRPLPDSPIGRTVLPAPTEKSSSFETTRCHYVHLVGFSLHIDGVPFQTQDQGVSACATTALWSALDCVVAKEAKGVFSPASITESATRYPLQEGRPFPNEGLTVRQICEATRAAGFSPLVIPGASFADNVLQISSYARSGFAPVLTLLPADGQAAGHAVCCVGIQTGPTIPQTNPSYGFREASSGLQDLYVHDDRLGPYAFANLTPWTYGDSQEIRTRVAIKWPDRKPLDSWYLHVLVVPVPQKLRLTISRLRRLGLNIAVAVADAFKEPQTTLNSRFELSHTYTKRIYEFDLSREGLYRAVSGTALSRYIGLIEITCPAGPVLDIVVDSTETNPESAVLACIKRSGFPETELAVFEAVANYLGVDGIS